MAALLLRQGRRKTWSNTAWPSTFPALRQRVNEHPLSFLDSAATTLRPQSVIDALVEYYSTDNANPSRVHTLASRAADRLSGARQTLARFVNAADSSEIIFVRGTTEGINLVASTWGATNLKPDDEVVLTIAEHSSNLLPWTRAARQAGAKVRVVDVDDDGRLRLDQFKASYPNEHGSSRSPTSPMCSATSTPRKRCAHSRATLARGS